MIKAQYSLGNTKPNLHWQPKTNLNRHLPKAQFSLAPTKQAQYSLANTKPNLQWQPKTNLNRHLPKAQFSLAPTKQAQYSLASKIQFSLVSILRPIFIGTQSSIFFDLLQLKTNRHSTVHIQPFTFN
jgi:hypothetical protein